MGSEEAMKVDEWRMLLEWMRVRWPEVGKWSRVTLDAYFDDVINYSGQAVADAVRWFYENGKKAPSGGQIVARLRELHVAPVRAIEGPCQHLWGILRYEETPDGLREAICVRCHVEKGFRARDLATESERVAGPNGGRDQRGTDSVAAF